MSVEERLNDVLSRIRNAEISANRLAGSVSLVAVSKTFDAKAIRPVIEAGQRVFGENRVQEAQGKWPELRAETPGIELHLIGPLLPPSRRSNPPVTRFQSHSSERIS